MPFDSKAMKELRLKRGLSMREAADAAGMNSRQHWAAYESARVAPSIEVAERIARALKAKLTDLIHD